MIWKKNKQKVLQLGSSFELFLGILRNYNTNCKSEKLLKKSVEAKEHMIDPPMISFTGDKTLQKDNYL